MIIGQNPTKMKSVFSNKAVNLLENTEASAGPLALRRPTRLGLLLQTEIIGEGIEIQIRFILACIVVGDFWMKTTQHDARL